MSDQPESLAAALADLQQHLPRIGKDAQAQYGRYADLADCTQALMPLLGALGLAFTARPTLIGAGNEAKFVLHYELMHMSGSCLSGDYPLPTTGNPQQIGSAITYARRYCLLAVTGAAPDEDDDDAQAAEEAAREQRRLLPETRADGSATEAELTRMNRGHEPGAWRSTSTAENDPFYDDQPPPVAVEDQPRSSLPSQRRSIYAALGVQKVKDHKSAIERLVRRDIDDPRDMSYNEAVSVLARVRSWDGRTEELLAPLVAVKEDA